MGSNLVVYMQIREPKDPLCTIWPVLSRNISSSLAGGVEKETFHQNGTWCTIISSNNIIILAEHAGPHLFSFPVCTPPLQHPLECQLNQIRVGWLVGWRKWNRSSFAKLNMQFNKKRRNGDQGGGHYGLPSSYHHRLHGLAAEKVAKSLVSMVWMVEGQPYRTVCYACEKYLIITAYSLVR